MYPLPPHSPQHLVGPGLGPGPGGAGASTSIDALAAETAADARAGSTSRAAGSAESHVRIDNSQRHISPPPFVFYELVSVSTDPGTRQIVGHLGRRGLDEDRDP